MAIIVNCSDGKIKIGGDFKTALAKVKAVQGRKYNPTSKEWTVPVEMKHFDMCGHPIDVLSGNSSRRFQSGAHQTRYGNVYKQDEWQAMREADTAMADAALPFKDREEKIKAKYQKILADLDLSPQAVTAILAWNFYDMVEFGKIQFSSPERESQIMKIRAGYDDEMMTVWQAADDAAELAREKVYMKYDID